MIGLIAAEVEAARRFSRAQLSNYQWRLELLHRSHAEGPDTDKGGGRQVAASGRNRFAAAQPPTNDSAADQRSDATITRLSGLNEGEQDLSGMMHKTGLPTATQPSETAPAARGIPETLMTALQTRSISLSDTGLSDIPSNSGAVGVWTGGDLVFGKRGARGRQGSLGFRTKGVTIAADKRFSDSFVAGLGLGYGHDKTDVGTNGTRLRAREVSVAYYGTYQPRPQTFVDAVLGYGVLDFDTDRYVAPMNDFARGHRNGEQVFDSLTLGHDYRKDKLTLSPYGRLDYSIDRLKHASESGAGLYALTYFGETVNSGDVVLGLRGESTHAMGSTAALPRFRVEYQHDLGSNRQTRVAYADLPNERYTVIPETTSRNTLLLAIGSDFLCRNGLVFGIDYEFRRSWVKERSQAIRLRLAMPLER